MTKISIKLVFTALLAVMGFFAIPKGRSESDAKVLVDGLYQRIITGDSFEFLATLYCEDVEAAKNGGIRVFERELLSRHFEKIVSALNKNGLSKPFKINNSYFIVELLDKSKEKLKIRYIQLSFTS